MRILVLSDTHGTHRNIELAIEAQPEAKHIIFCGDGLNEIEYEEQLNKDRIFHKVRGNNDMFSSEDKTKIVKIENKTILITHGHSFFVKSSLHNLINKAKSVKADIVVFGHTHKAYQNYEDGLYVLNPGSASYHSYPRTYGYIDIINNSIITNIVHY